MGSPQVCVLSRIVFSYECFEVINFNAARDFIHLYILYLYLTEIQKVAVTVVHPRTAVMTVLTVEVTLGPMTAKIR